MKKQLTILFALVAMTGWAQTAKRIFQRNSS